MRKRRTREQMEAARGRERKLGRYFERRRDRVADELARIVAKYYPTA